MTGTCNVKAYKSDFKCVPAFKCKVCKIKAVFVMCLTVRSTSLCASFPVTLCNNVNLLSFIRNKYYAIVDEFSFYFAPDCELAHRYTC